MASEVEGGGHDSTEEIESDFSALVESDVSSFSAEYSSQEFDENMQHSPLYRGRENNKQVQVEADPAEQEVISADNTKDFALRSLKAMGLHGEDIRSFTAGMGAKGYSALANFHVACEHFNLPLAWGSKQVKAFLIFINYKYYSAPYVARMWHTIQSLGKLLSQPLSSEQEADYELVYQQAKDIQDNKVPVSKKLLHQLCKAADLIFEEYNASLAKAMFTAAWAGYMRVGEYSRTSDKDGNKHNLKADALITSPAGLSITFRSDKTSKSADPFKHRFISWRSLPAGSQDAFRDYDRLRPLKAINYFCREDGVELTRSVVLNLLDACILLTPFRLLNVTPHCFRLGAASHDRLHGLSMVDILEKGRWRPQSKAIEAYTRPDMVVLQPQDLFDRLPKYRRIWRFQRLNFLSRCMVEVGSPLRIHPFQQVLDTHFPSLRNYQTEEPDGYPYEAARDRLAELKYNREHEVYLRIMEEEEAKKIRECFSRGQTAAVVRRNTQQRIRQGPLPFSYSTPSAVAGVSDNRQTQASVCKQDSGSQTDHVVVLSSGEALQLASRAIVPVQGIRLPNRRTNFAEKVQGATSSEKLFEVFSLGEKLALSKQQLQQRRRKDPALTVRKRSYTASRKFELRAKIRRRISRRYREHRNQSTKGGVTQPPIKKTESMIKMIEFFMAEIQEKGESGLPVRMDEWDPVDPVEEEAYEREVMLAYEQKPVNYEEILKVKLHDGSANRKDLQTKRKKPAKKPVVQLSESEDESLLSSQHAMVIGDGEQLYELVPGPPLSFLPLLPQVNAE